MSLAVVLSLSLVAAAILCAQANGADEGPAAKAWFASAFLGEQPAGGPAQVGLEVKRQDHGELGLRKSAINTPIIIGSKHYEHGLGTHSVSEIVVRLPEPAKSFEAEVGIDNNLSTGGQRGSVTFAVESGSEELFRSGVRKGTDGPLPVKVDLKGAKELTLRVTDAGDGPGWDQSDWADASVTLQSGERLWLDDIPVRTDGRLSPGLPFSFTYGGRPSAELLPSWKRTQSVKDVPGGKLYTIAYTDPQTGLEVSCEARSFSDYPAAEWVLHLRNSGTADTPIVENVLPLDLRMSAGPQGDIVFHHAHGSTCEATDFLPADEKVAPNAEVKLAPFGGRSSNKNLPFFNLEWRNGGMAWAVGWSGQWAMNLKRDQGRGLAVQAGQQTTHLKLHPGESIRTPRILIVTWQGQDRMRGNNLLRRLLLEHYVPKIDRKPALPPVAHVSFFFFNAGNDVNEQNQLETIEKMAKLGVEAYWLDAGWFEGGWPSGVGSWVPKKEAFPRGLKPLGDAAHKHGMKFVVWFEPERVNGASRIAKEHPEWVMHAGAGDGLFNLGDPDARRWLTDYLSKCIGDWGIDVYRNDFNIEPLPFWQAADAPDRQGMAEIRYVEGLYEMWDELLRRHPGMIIDDCASGGRRIDLETISRSIPLWRSDTQCCGSAQPVWDQSQALGLNCYVPLHAAGLWGFDPYTARSLGAPGASICPDPRAKEFDAKGAVRAITEAKALRPYYLGDYHPMVEGGLDERQWAGWQFDRPEIGGGFAVFLRRPQSPYTTVDAPLRGLDRKARYEVQFVDAKRKQVMTGEELAKLKVSVDSAPGSVLIRYQKAGQ